MSTKPISRSDGRSAVAAAAYRAAEVLVDERTGLVHDFTLKKGVVSAVLVFPGGGTVDRQSLWNAAESCEKRKDARTAREWLIALPYELTEGARIQLAQEFGGALARKYGIAVDVAVHDPDHHGDDRNFHAHLLCSTRQVTLSDGEAPLFGKKADIELGNKDRGKTGIRGTTADEIFELRELWAGMVNGALSRAGISDRIDHRTLEAQRSEALAAGDVQKADALDREPSKHLGPTASTMDRYGRQPSRRGEEHRARLSRNQARATERSQVRALLSEVESEIEAVRTSIRTAEAAAAGGGITKWFPTNKPRREADQVDIDALDEERKRRTKVETEEDGRRRQEQKQIESESVVQKRRREDWDRFRAEASSARPGDDARGSVDYNAPAWSDRRLGWLARRYQDPDLAQRLREIGVRVDWVSFGRKSDQLAEIRLAGGAALVDEGSEMLLDRTNDDGVKLMVALAIAKGWSSIEFDGSPEFIQRALEEADRASLRVTKINGRPTDERDGPRGSRM